MFRSFLNRRSKGKELKKERELLDLEHQNRIREIEIKHDHKVIELFQSCCDDALSDKTDSRDVWDAIRMRIDAAKLESDKIQEETLAAHDAEHRRYSNDIRSLYKKYGFNLSDE